MNSPADMTNAGSHPRQVPALWEDYCRLKAAARSAIDLLDRFPMQTAILMRAPEIEALRKEAAKS